MTTAVIRELCLPDIPDVVSMVRESVDEKLWPFMIYGQHGISKFLAVPLQYTNVRSDRRSYILSHNDAVMAYADFRLYDSEKAFLSYIYVQPEVRGRGVATDLIFHFLERYPQIVELQLDVLRHNVPAKTLYTKLGFETTNRTAWVTRALPEPHGSVPIASLAVSMAAYHVYGFCELKVNTGGKFGLMGPRIVRCFSAADFIDDVQLKGLRNAFPSTEEAFAVIDEIDLKFVGVTHQVINRSDRMKLLLGPEKQRPVKN